MPVRKIEGGSAAELDGDEILLDDEEGVSGKRVRARSTPNDDLVADLRRRSAGLRGAELEQEIDTFVERVIEYHASAAPPGPLREEIRRTMRAMVEHDPSVSRIVRELREAAEL